MERMKKVVSLLLCLVMVVGLMPVSIFTANAAETVLDAAIFCSDVHGSTSDLTSVLSGVKTSGVDYSSIGFVGDTCLTVANTTSTVQSTLNDTDIAVMFSYAASHGSDNGADIGDDWDFSGEVKGISDYYLVYTIRETDMQSDTGADEAFTTWYSGLTDAQKKLPIFIMSHRPLHARRNDNAGAAGWYTAISAAAKTSDIVFFWAHNHTGETSVDTDAYYVAKNGTETISVQGGSTVIPNFTYMNAGYINANNQDPARLNVATTVQITADSMIFQDYTTSGEYTNSSYSHNVTVTRDAVATDSGSGDGDTTTETKEVYVLVDAMTVGKDYLIANGNSGSVTLLGQSSGSATTTTAEVKTSGDYTYIETDDAGYVWNATAHTNSSYSNYPRLINAETYAMYASSGALAFSSSLTSTSGAVYTRYWTYTDGQLACVSTNSSSTTYYLTYSDGYSMTATATDGIYIYEKQTITVSSDGTVSGGGSTEGGDSGDDDTTGGSTETVVGDGTYTTADDGSYQKVTFGTEGEEKTVYVLTDTLTEGKNYLIVSSNATGSGNAFEYGNTSGETVTINAATTATGDVYIETTNTSLIWQYDSSSRFYNAANTGYLRIRKDQVTVTTSTDDASTVGMSGNCIYRKNGDKYFCMYYGSNGWDSQENSSIPSTSTYNVYIYEEKTIDTSTSVTYSVTASDIEHFYTADTTDTETVTIAASVTEGTPGGAYAYEVVGGDEILTVSDDGVITFNGAEGTAQVKVSYSWTEGENTYVIWQVIDVTATSPYYTLDLHKQTTDDSGNPAAGDEITDIIAIKGVEAGDTYSVWAVVKYFDGTTEDGENLGDVEDNMIEWTSSDPTVATVDPATGIITFTGKDGTVNITATYLDGNKPSDTITISATTSQYSVPSDGTNDFPEYPNEGAIRYDKTATAVGNFSETGIAMVELSMTGVPYTTGSEIDVVVMLDMTGSMSDNGMEAAELATIAFMEKIVKNEDGTYNNNRIAVYAFNSGSSSPYELVSLKKITSDDELATATTAIKTASDKQASGGTPFDEAAKQCYDVLQAAKTDGTGNDRQQFCVFMSDGGPTTYYGSDEKTYYGGNNNSGDALLTSCMSGYSSSDSSDWSFTLPSEYYTDKLKADGVVVYTVGLLLQTAPSNPAPYSSMTDSTYDSTTDSLTTIGSHYYFCSSILKQMASDDSKYIDIFNVDNASKATAAFESIALSILQAATDVTVEDQITDEYTMIFGIPTDTNYNHSISTTQEFYIEFLKYTLDSNHERMDSDSDGNTYEEATSVTKLYLIDSNGSTVGGTYSAGSSATTAYAAPVFAQSTIGDKGTLYYWTTDQTMATKAAVSYNDGTNTYYFIPYGMEANEDGTAPTGWYNMTSGAYAYGTVDSVTNTSTDLVIATPYFVYNASTKKLYWTVDKLDTAEYALRYFLYLDNSATDVGETTEVPAATYPTNHHAYITYTNFNKNECRQEFPIPQLTWNGAQVSYVFYLVNSAGQPINKSGQVVDFANATFVTDVYTTAVVWNKGADGQVEGDANLSIDWLASKLLPSDYLLYDTDAGYELKVYADASGEAIFNYFIIEGGTATKISTSLNQRLSLSTTESTVSVETTKVYNTKAGTKYDDYGTYTSKDASNITGETILTGFDFANSTVAFAVVWQPKLVEDVVVVDYGLDVVINVVQNDLLQNTISGIGVGKDAYGNTAMNTGVSTESKLGTAALTIDGNTISIENENAVRFHQGDMTFTEPVKFYYESPAQYYEGSNQKTGYMYSSVTVIPATTIYYEDDFVTLKTYTKASDYTKVTYSTDSDSDTTYYTLVDGEYVEVEEPIIGNEYYIKEASYNVANGWATNSVAASAVQQQDRPGASKISEALDADNNYGYDAAYEDQSLYSMGNAAKVTVKSGVYATAEFEFYGTGFDIISLTDTTTGVIVCKVYDAVGNQVISETVNNYYGYAREYYKVTYTYDAETEAWNATEEKVTTLGESGTAPENPTAGATYTVYETRWVTTTSNDPNALYQVPVLKIGDGDTTEALSYGKYKAVITVTYMSFMDKTSAEGYDFYLDAIRIYNPTGNKNDVANEAYKADGEGWPAYHELRNLIISAEKFNSLEGNTSISGIVFIDGATTTGADDAASVADYISYGPNNELYLEAGNAVAFDLNATASAGEVAKIQLAIKTVGGSGSVQVYSVDSNGNTKICLDQEITTATDMYFDITELNGKTVVIKNTGEDSENAIISITNVKITYTEEQPVTEPDNGESGDDSGVSTASNEEISEPVATFSISRNTASYALMSMYVEEDVEEDTTEPETEATEPETTEPETEGTEPETEGTEPETEVTEPETEPEETQPEDSNTGSTLIKIIKKLLGWLFG